MPMELRKRKAPANPPPPAPAKKTKTAPAKKKIAAKAEEVKKAVAPKKPAAKKETKKAAEKKEAVPAPADEKAPEPEAPAAAEPVASASTTAPAAAPAKKGRGKAAAKETKDADAKADAKAAKADKAEAVPKLKVGDALPTDLAEITLDDGTKTTFGALLDASEKGIVLFSYTKASTPGCTTQACALRDNYTQFKDAGYLVYGLSGDSHTDNAKFKSKQNLGYPLLSDPTYLFHEKLGIKSAKAGTVRSVIVVQKEGKIIKELKGVQPKTSLDVARKAVGIEAPAEEEKKDTKKETKKEKEAKSKEVAVGKEAPAAAAAPVEAPAATTEEAAKPAESS